MTGAADVDAYIAALDAPFRGAIERLRADILSLLPEGQETISYAMPGVRQGGKMVAGYAAFSKHCGFYPHSGRVIPSLGDRIDAEGLKRSKSGITFPPDRLPSRDLLEAIITGRLAEAGLA